MLSRLYKDTFITPTEIILYRLRAYSDSNNILEDVRFNSSSTGSHNRHYYYTDILILINITYRNKVSNIPGYTLKRST